MSRAFFPFEISVMRLMIFWCIFCSEEKKSWAIFSRMAVNEFLILHKKNLCATFRKIFCFDTFRVLIFSKNLPGLPGIWILKEEGRCVNSGRLSRGGRELWKPAWMSSMRDKTLHGVSKFLHKTIGSIQLQWTALLNWFKINRLEYHKNFTECFKTFTENYRHHISRFSCFWYFFSEI